MISYDYSIDECVAMIRAMGIQKILLYKRENVPQELDAKCRYYITTGGVVLAERDNDSGPGIRIDIIHPNNFWIRRISMIVSYAFNEWIKSEVVKRPNIPRLTVLLNKFHRIGPRKSLILT